MLRCPIHQLFNAHSWTQPTDNEDTSDQVNFKVATYKRMMPLMLEVLLQTQALDPCPCTANTFWHHHRCSWWMKVWTFIDVFKEPWCSSPFTWVTSKSPKFGFGNWVTASGLMFSMSCDWARVHMRWWARLGDGGDVDQAIWSKAQTWREEGDEKKLKAREYASGFHFAG